MNQDSLEALKDIQHIMAKSSRFISLSGLSGIAAGTCALIGAFFAHTAVESYYQQYSEGASVPSELRNQLILIAAAVFVAALLFAFLFTYKKSKKDGLPLGGEVSKRLIWNTLVPMFIGGVLILKLISLKSYALIAPASLLFYGLGLINGSKYTLAEIKYLGYMQLVLGMLNLWLPKYGLHFWVVGFGILHIFYGAYMWRKYETSPSNK